MPTPPVGARCPGAGVPSPPVWLGIVVVVAGLATGLAVRAPDAGMASSRPEALLEIGDDDLGVDKPAVPGQGFELPRYEQGGLDLGGAARIEGA
jgi:hypothetical protein